MRPVLRIGFTDYFKPLDEFFIDVLSERYDVVRDDANPEYLIFCDETFGRNNLKYDHTKIKKIFFTGENRRPWDYQAHHAISFDHLDGPRYYRLPLYVVEDWVFTHKKEMSSIWDRAEPMKKTGFCSFIVSNGGCRERNEIFRKLNEYKQVDSGGPLFNNVGYVLPRGEDAYIQKFGFMRTRKFSICYENSSYPGYTTEKLYQGLYARTIPIYWGDPLAFLDFSEKTFISRHDYRSDEEMIEYIKEIDNDDFLYDKIIETDLVSVVGNKYFNLDAFLNWWDDFVYFRR